MESQRSTTETKSRAKLGVNGFHSTRSWIFVNTLLQLLQCVSQNLSQNVFFWDILRHTCRLPFYTILGSTRCQWLRSFQSLWVLVGIKYLFFQLGTTSKSNVHDSTIIFAIVLTRRRLFTETSLKSWKIKICALKIEIFWYPVYISVSYTHLRAHET